MRLSAISLLHSLAQNANEIDNIDDRVRLLSEIGDAYWLVDRNYSWTVLIRSFKEIDKLVPRGDDGRELFAGQKRNLRQIVLLRIAKHDPALAKQLIEDQVKDTPTMDEKASKLYGADNPSSEAFLSIAQSLIATDPKRAALIASYSLRDGLSQRFRYFLIRRVIR